MTPNQKNNKLIVILILIAYLQNCTNMQLSQNGKLYKLEILDREKPNTKLREETSIRKEDSKPADKQKKKSNKCVSISEIVGLDNGIKDFPSHDYEKRLGKAHTSFITMISKKYPEIKENLSDYFQHSLDKHRETISCTTCGKDILNSLGSTFIFDIREFKEKKHPDNYSLYCSENCVEKLEVNNLEIGYLFSILNKESANILSDSQYLDYLYRALCFTENYSINNTYFKKLIYTKAWTILENSLNQYEIPAIVLDRLINLKYDFLLDFENQDKNEMLKILLFINFCTEDDIEELQEATYLDDLDLERNPITSKSYGLIDTGLSIAKIDCSFQTFIKWDASAERVDRFLETFATELKNLDYDQIYELAKFYTICSNKCLIICEKLWEKIGKKNVEKNLLMLQCKHPEILKLLLLKTKDGGLFSDNTFNKMSIGQLKFLIHDIDNSKAKAILNCENIDELSADNIKLIDAASLDQLQIAISTVKNDLSKLTREIVIKSGNKSIKKTPNVQKLTPEKLNQGSEKKRKPIFTKNNNPQEIPPKRLFSTIITPREGTPSKSDSETPKYSRVSNDSIPSEDANTNRTNTGKSCRTMPRSEIRQKEVQISSKNDDSIRIPEFLRKSQEKLMNSVNTRVKKNKSGQITPQKSNTNFTTRSEAPKLQGYIPYIPYNPHNQDQNFTFEAHTYNLNDTEQRSSANSELDVYRNNYIPQQKESVSYSTYMGAHIESVDNENYSHLKSTISTNLYPISSTYSNTNECKPIKTTQRKLNNNATAIKEPQKEKKLPTVYGADEKYLNEIMSKFPWLSNQCLSEMKQWDKYILIKALNDKNNQLIKQILSQFFEESNMKNLRLIEELSEYILKS